jgi:asparagine synthase (glutamine-hydrolysing)
MVFWDLMKKKLLDPSCFPAPKVAPEMVECGLLQDSYLEADSFKVIKSFYGPFDASHPNSDPLTRMIYSEFKLRLPELLLMRVDKIGMSTSIEARVPFLDHKLVEFTMDIPEQDKIRNQDPKYLLKKAVRGLIPNEIIDRKKMGFGAPMSQWMRGSFGIRAQDSILRSPLIDRLGFDRGFINELCAGHISGRSDNSVFIWTLFNLVEWHRYWIEEEA